MIDEKVKVYIEIEQYSNLKYEFDKNENKLILDRILPYPYFYPFSYGYIVNTLADDGDDLDALIITCKEDIKMNNYFDVYIIGVLIMEDEKGMDEKILCVLEEDYYMIKNIDNISDEVKENIHWFFSNYKKKNYEQMVKSIRL